MAGMLWDLMAKLPEDGTLVFLGDYIDRGGNSYEVVDTLLHLAADRPCVFLRGNHERWAIAAGTLLPDEFIHYTWWVNGGDATYECYLKKAHYQQEEAHLEFLSNTRMYYETDEYIFVHAGLRPGLTPDQCSPDVLLEVRNEFLLSDCNWGKRVIHGHTPTYNREPEFKPNRIGIDTGAVMGGWLTALLLPEETFIRAKYAV